ncbi:tetratricopeptide repeat protein [Planctomicrobium sp. SH664]|uniref:tetratricopeptide repeat protein n=1 Tax=Planctomicrobium sp. SH664 TaxID=3448125 RepID=UPI003F5CAF66
MSPLHTLSQDNSVPTRVVDVLKTLGFCLTSVAMAAGAAGLGLQLLSREVTSSRPDVVISPAQEPSLLALQENVRLLRVSTPVRNGNASLVQQVAHFNTETSRPPQSQVIGREQRATELAQNSTAPHHSSESNSDVSHPLEDSATTLLPEEASQLPELREFETLSEPQIDPLEQLAQGDELLLEGNSRLALHLYLPLVGQASGLFEAHLRLRIGLCDEALGDLRQAQIEYRRVVELKPDSNLLEAAILGQARVWSLSSRRELAIATLYRALLEGSHPRRDALNSPFPHQLGLLLASRIENSETPVERQDEPLQVRQLSVFQPVTRPEVVLAELTAPLPPSPAVAPLIPHGITVVQQSRRTVDDTVLDVDLGRLTVPEILQQVAQQTGFQLSLPATAQLQLQEHTLQCHYRNLPLGIVLDALLAPYEMIWMTGKGEQIVVLPAQQASGEEIEQYRHHSAERTLRFAGLSAPEHPWNAISLMELGRLAFQANEPEQAIRQLTQSLETFPRGEHVALAWFNIAKLRLAQGEAATALQAFQRAVDLLSGHTLEPIAYLFLGRIQLEQEAPREAIAPLTRALALSVGSRFESVSALTLSCAYVLLGHHQRANQILVDHRPAFTQPAHLDQAAFLASLIRYRAAAEQREQLREGGTMIAALSNLQLSRCFGGQWPYLAGLAFRDTGMVPEEIKVFQQCLETSYPFALQNQMRSSLIQDAGPTSSLASPQGGAALPPNLRYHALIADAALAYRDGDLPCALSQCSEIVRDAKVPDPARREALKLMGYVFQVQGDHRRAVQCFTGVLPTEQPAPATSQRGVHP